MAYALSKYEKESVLLYNQSSAPILIGNYDLSLRRRLAEYAEKYPDYAEYEIAKDRIPIRLIPPIAEEQKEAARERAMKAGLSGGENAKGIHVSKD